MGLNMGDNGKSTQRSIRKDTIIGEKLILETITKNRLWKYERVSL